MKRRNIVDRNKLNEVLASPELEEEFQEVFSFVEDITGCKTNIDDLTPKEIEDWNNKFGEVLQQMEVLH